MDVFINDISAFLPNAAVDNSQIEEVLGRINNIPSKAKRIVLKNNQITTRYYAVDPETGRLTHTNAQLTAAAIRGLNSASGFELAGIECLTCGTTSPDLLFPGHALAVLGELGLPPCDAVTTAGICICGMTALKYGFMSVAAGITTNAVATGSELASSFMRAGFMAPVINGTRKGDPRADLEKKPIRAFDADFLRWMLSDGAGAAYLSAQPRSPELNLKIEWIDQLSYAGELATCMYSGGVKDNEGGMAGWRDLESISPEDAPYLFTVRQDIKQLDRYIIPTMGRALAATAEKHGLKPDDVDWFIPHYSSAYFRPRFHDEMERIDFGIPYERWFTNLSSKGNTGSAAIFIILEELLNSGKLRPGEKLLCFIPESGRFSHCFMLLTVV